MNRKYLDFRNLGELKKNSEWIEEEILFSENISVIYNSEKDFLCIIKEYCIDNTRILVVIQENGIKFVIPIDHWLI